MPVSKLNPDNKIKEINIAKKSKHLVLLENFIKYFQIFVFALVIICLFATVLLSVSIYKSDIIELSLQLDKQQTVIDSKTKQLDEYQKTEIDYSVLADSTKKILDILPDNKALADIFIELDVIAQNNDLKLASINVSQPKALAFDIKNIDVNKNTIENLKDLDVNIELIGGDYFKLKNFVADLETSLRLMEIKSIVYSYDTDKFILSLKTYYFES